MPAGAAARRDCMIGEELEALVVGAKDVLASNDLGGWTKPAPDLYPHQWNWDSCFIAIGLSRFNFDRASQELRSLVRGQWANGLIPQIIFNPAGKGYFPGPDVWQSNRCPEAPKGVETSGITQPPVMATAALAVWKNAPADRKSEAQEFLRDMYPHLLSYHEFFYSERNPDGDGLIVVVHPWESGTDNSPRYLEAGKRVHLSYKPHYERLDTLHVAAANRPTDKDYDLFVYLLEQMRDVNWNQKAYLRHAPLQVQDVLFNSVLCRANLDLAAIAGILGEDAGRARDWFETTQAAINARCWDESDGMYYDYDRVAQEPIKIDTISGLHTLYGDVATKDRAERMVEVHLVNPRLFWPADGFPVPTTAVSSDWFNPENYWLGPVWVSTNWMLAHGLAAYARTDLAATVTTRTLDLVNKSGYREYFNPYTGAGYGTGSFSWTAALSIDLIAEMGEPV
jgi:hypothetical protein